MFVAVFYLQGSSVPTVSNDSGARRLFALHRDLGWPLVALLVIAIVLGGGGIRHGLTNLVVQLVALAVILFQPGAIRRFFAEAPLWLKIVVPATLLLPVLQLLPLPAGIWRALPGREMAAETRDLIGFGEAWFPATLDRARTVIAFFALAGPFAVLLCARGFSGNWRRSALVLIVALAFLHFTFGVLQFAVGGDTLALYETNGESPFYGFFVGHISSGLFLVIGLCALVGLYASKKRTSLDYLIYPAGAALLVIGVILTASRSSVALLALPGLWIAWLAWQELRRLSPKMRWIVIGGSMILLAIAVVVMATNQRLGQTWSRFEDFEDSRPDIWEDTLVGIDRYWPVGSGMGTFDEVFQVEESLETLPAKKAARAHNEYLEVALEAGIFGIALILAWVAGLLYSAYRRLRTVHAPVTLAAAMSLLCIALQALIYFPLRNMAVLCIAGLLVALLTAPVKVKRDRVSE